MYELVITKPDDFHCHLRNGDLLKLVVNFTAEQFRRATVMPNTNPPILTADDATEYKKLISYFAKEGFEPLMTIQITERTTPQMIKDAKRKGVAAGKVYPLGVTTNSQNGVENFQKLYPIFSEMERTGMLLLLHGESPDPCLLCLDREIKFLEILMRIAKNFPNLRMVLEHITTKAAVQAVSSLSENVAATITVHHLVLTLNDVIGDLIEPHNFCKPVAKRFEDRRALRKAAISSDPKFFYGGDSAPHLKENKESAHGCAGIFNAPVALPLLAQVFEEEGCLCFLENFVAKFGADFYGLQQNTETIRLVKEDWIVPKEYNGIVPFMTGRILHWQIAQ